MLEIILLYFCESKTNLFSLWLTNVLSLICWYHLSYSTRSGSSSIRKSKLLAFAQSINSGQMKMLREPTKKGQFRKQFVGYFLTHPKEPGSKLGSALMDFYDPNSRQSSLSPDRIDSCPLTPDPDQLLTPDPNQFLIRIHS